jgi:ribonuclease HI
MVISIFTDGSCTKNGSKNGIGGIGVYFGSDDPRNVSKNLDTFYSDYFPDEARTKATNNKAELSAILCALALVQDSLNLGEKIVIYTDSMYSINCLAKWWKGWRKNGWKNAAKKTIGNYSVITEIVEKYIIKYGSLIAFQYVKAHTQLSPIHTQKELFEWRGNREADRLATSFLD